MKLNKLFLGAIAALASAAMVACSDDAPDNPGGENTIGKEGGYIAVNIVAPTGASSRATDGGLLVGSANENEVVNVTFFLFKGDTFFGIQPAKTIETTSSQTPNTTGQNIEKIVTATMVIDGKKPGDPLPDNFVTVLNLTEDQINGFKVNEPKTLSELKGKFDDYIYGATSKIDATKKTFIMSNSVYANGSDEVCSTATGDLYTKPDEATQHPVTVYVERVAAKVNISNKATADGGVAGLTQTHPIFTWDSEKGNLKSEEVNITLEVQGIGIVNTTNSSYLFKNISTIIPTLNANWPAWTDATTNHRSYWATSVDQFNTNPAWSEIPALGTDGSTFYIHENTTSNSQNYTSVIAKVQLKANGNGKSMVQWSGKIYEPSTFPVMMAQNLNNLGYKIKGASDDAYRGFKPEDLTMIETVTDATSTVIDGFKQWQTCCQLSATATGSNFTKIDASATETEINDFLKASANRANYWKNGMSYYYVPIEHFGQKDEATPAAYDYSIGVVRNHLYQLTITGFTGLGTPVWNPDKPIDPGKPDDDETLYYLAAKINILSWKVVKQDVNFGE